MLQCDKHYGTDGSDASCDTSDVPVLTDQCAKYVTAPCSALSD